MLIANVVTSALSYAALTLLTSCPPPQNPPIAPSLSKRPSLIPKAGDGLFASSRIPRGTPLGRYPGNVVLKSIFIERKKTLPTAPGQYSWILDSQYLIDPTSVDGSLQEFVAPGNVASKFPFSETLWSLLPPVRTLIAKKNPTLLCLCNEPPLGGDCNVSVEVSEDKQLVIFSTSRDVESGEELYIDYGKSYDRSTYSDGDERKWETGGKEYIEIGKDRKNRSFTRKRGGSEP